MKKLLKKTLIFLTIIVILFAGGLILLDKVIMPNVVNRKIVEVPELTGLKKDQAIKILENLNLTPVLEGPRYNNKYPKDYVIFQKPHKGSKVKINRRIYLAISGGEPLSKLPDYRNKSLRDAKISIERLGLKIGKISEVRSELKANTIVDQSPEPGKNLPKGSTVDLTVSIGPNVGKVRVPDLLGKTLTEAKNILRINSLKLGNVNYQKSQNLLPNTVIAQYPDKGELVDIGEKIDLFITKAGNE